jgi:hypothetical protein
VIRSCCGSSRGSVIDGDDLAASEQLADGGEEERATALGASSLDDQRGEDGNEQLLVDPEVERGLERPHAEPASVLPRARRRLVVETMKVLDDSASTAFRQSQPMGDAVGEPHAPRVTPG